MMSSFGSVGNIRIRAWIARILLSDIHQRAIEAIVLIVFYRRSSYRFRALRILGVATVSEREYSIRLQEMLSRHGIVRPDGRPLYRYHFSQGEYSRAVDMMTADGRRALREPEGCALFVMVMAEWFRRNREGGGWSWDPRSPA